MDQATPTSKFIILFNLPFPPEWSQNSHPGVGEDTDSIPIPPTMPVMTMDAPMAVTAVVMVDAPIVVELVVVIDNKSPEILGFRKPLKP